MRLIKRYTFNIGKKIPFSELPEIVHKFLSSEGLRCGRFLYYFHEHLHYRPIEEAIKTGSCAKAVKDCPALGEIRPCMSCSVGVNDMLILSNIDQATECTEADVLPHMKKIHRRYGFGETHLYYYDVDFFQNVIPFARDFSQVEEKFAKYPSPDYKYSLQNQPYGSGIELTRYSTGPVYLELSIDLLHNGKVMDDTAYANAMKALLPHRNPHVSVCIYLSEEEKQRISLWDTQAIPIVEQSRDFFAEKIPTQHGHAQNFPSYKLAPKLKKLAKQYGYSYHYEQFGMYVLDKKMERGHVLRLMVDSGPSRFDTGYIIEVQGLGFSHRIYTSVQTPENQQESDACSEMVLSALSEFEQTILPKWNSLYDETPEWYVPSFN